MTRKMHRIAVFGMAWLVGTSAAAAAQVGSPAGAVPMEALEARRAGLLDRLASGLAVVASAAPRSIEGDYPQDSDYRETSDFFYLTGLEAPGGRLVLRAHAGAADSVTLYLPARDLAMETWTGPRLGPGAEASGLTGITDVRALDDFGPDMTAWLRAGGGSPTLYVDIPMAQRSRCPAPTTAPRCAPILEALEVPAHVEVASVSDHIAALRLVKDADELRRLREAIRITAEAHRAGAAALEPGMWEYQLEAVIEFTFRWHGAERVGFPSIIGSGPYATILHYDRSRRRMEAGDLVVVDIGAEYGYYSADVTRTYPVSGTFNERQRAIYNLVLASQQAAIDSVRPGTTVGRLNAIARDYMRSNSGALCAPRSCDAYFIHGLSHWLGMDVHDVGAYDVPLESGMVLTIEPGIYIPDEQIGVRIEDDVLVTDHGHQLLSSHAPRAAEAVETLMAQPASARALQR